MNNGRHLRGLPSIKHKNSKPASGRLAAALAAGILLATVILAAFVFLPLSSAPQLRMTVLRDSVQEVGYGESAHYFIDIRNVGEDGSGVFKLKLTDVPEKWEAELSDDTISLAASSHRKVILTVTAPTMRAAAADAGMDGGIDRVASVGIRSGNVSVGTVTILTGQLTLERAGESYELDPADTPYYVEPGDLLTSNGLALVELDMELLFPGAGRSGELYLGLNEASIGIWRQNETAFIWISSGAVVVYWPGGTGAGGGSRADASDWNMKFDNDPDIDAAFPELEYSSVISFQATADPVLFHVGSMSEDAIPVSVYEGTLHLATSESKMILTMLESVRVSSGDTSPSPDPLYGIVLETKSGDQSGGSFTGSSVEETVTVDGKNFFEIGRGPDDAVMISDVGGRNIYIIPASRGYIPDVNVTHNGRTEGFYRTTIRYMGNYSTTSFDFTSTSTSVTQDVVMFSFSPSTLSGSTLVVEHVNGEEIGKSYDLGLSYMKEGMGRKEEFNVTSMSTSDEIQTFRVIDWLSFDVPDATPVQFSQGEFTVPVRDGDTGEDIRGRMQGPGPDDGDDSDLIMIYQATAVAVIVLALLTGILIGTRKRKARGRKPRGKKAKSTVSFKERKQENMIGTGEGKVDEGLLQGPGIRWPETTTETDREKTVKKAVSEETKEVTTLDPIEEGQSAFFAGWGADEPEGPAAAETVLEKEAAEETEREEEEEEKGVEKEQEEKEPLMPGFPVSVECHVCGKDYNIKTPSIYKCKQCNTPFKIDRDGKYVRPMKRDERGKGKTHDTGRESDDERTGQPGEGGTAGVLPDGMKSSDAENKATNIPPCPNCGRKGNRITDEFIGEVRCKRCFIKYFVSDEPVE